MSFSDKEIERLAGRSVSLNQLNLETTTFTIPHYFIQVTNAKKGAETRAEKRASLIYAIRSDLESHHVKLGYWAHASNQDVSFHHRGHV